MPTPKSRSYPRFATAASARPSLPAARSRVAPRAGLASGISIGSLKKSWTPSPSKKPTVASNGLDEPPDRRRGTRRGRASAPRARRRRRSSSSRAGRRRTSRPRGGGCAGSLVARGHDRVGELGREEAPQPPSRSSSSTCGCTRSSSVAVELQELGGLGLDRVVVALDPEQRTDAGEELVVVERLRDEVVGAGLDRPRLLRADARRDHDHRQHRGLVVARAAAGRPRSRPCPASRRRAGPGRAAAVATSSSASAPSVAVTTS